MLATRFGNCSGNCRLRRVGTAIIGQAMLQGTKLSYSISARLSTFLCDSQSRIRHRVRQSGRATIGTAEMCSTALRKPERELLDRTASLSYPDRTESTQEQVRSVKGRQGQRKRRSGVWLVVCLLVMLIGLGVASCAAPASINRAAAPAASATDAGSSASSAPPPTPSATRPPRHHRQAPQLPPRSRRPHLRTPRRLPRRQLPPLRQLQRVAPHPTVQPAKSGCRS